MNQESSLGPIYESIELSYHFIKCFIKQQFLLMFLDKLLRFFLSDIKIFFLIRGSKDAFGP